MNILQEQAARRGMPLLAKALEAAPAPGTPFERFPGPPAEGQSALGLMIRWGPEPSLVGSALTWFDGRPLERGLFAWDVLNQAVYTSAEASLVDTLRRATEPVRDLLPAPGALGVDTARRTTHGAVAELAAADFKDVPDAILANGLAQNALGAVTEVVRRAGSEAFKTLPLASSLLPFCRSMHLTGASTLASFYLDYLAKWLGQREAWTELLEVLLDVEALDRLPEPHTLVESLGEEAAEPLAYMAGRSQVIQGTASTLLAGREFVTAAEDAEQAHERAAVNPRIQLALADTHRFVGGFPIPYTVLNAIVAQRPDWRYAAEVRLAVASLRARSDPRRFVSLVNNYVSCFGGRRQLWDLALSDRTAPWWDELCAQLSGELAAAPHRRDLWASLARHAGGGDAASEVERAVAIRQL